MKDDIGWMHGTLWTTKEACEKQCQILHHRLGIKEAPRAVIPVAALRERLESIADSESQDYWEVGYRTAFQNLLAELEGV